MRFRVGRFRWLVAVALLAAGEPSALAQEGPPVAYPMLLPRAILALRGEEQDRTQLRLTFDRVRESESDPPLTVWIGADYFAVVDGPRLTITDLRLRRRFVVDRAAKTLVNLSLYGGVMFRRVELARRMDIARQLSKEKNGAALPESLGQFWIESELGIAGPEPLPAPIEQRQNGTVTIFEYHGQNVAASTPSDTSVPADLRRGYGAFVRDTLPLHPQIAGWLAASGTVPARLDYVSEARGRNEAVYLMLRGAETVSEDYPLPPKLSLQLLPAGNQDPDVALMRRVLPHMVSAATMRGEDGPTQLAAFRTTIDRDFQEHRNFDAALRLAELALRWGRDATACGQDGGPCRSKAEIDRALGGDRQARTMFEATALQARDPKQAIAIWRRLDRKDVASGYVVDIFLARLLSARGDRGAAARSFAAAFAGDPYIRSLYRDLGDYFARASRFDLAWLCYDFGRELPNRVQPDALSTIDDMEQQLVKSYPDLF